MTDKKADLEQIKWAVESRSRNQMSVIRLLELFDKYEARWNSKKYSRAAQDLSSVAFSLWRAAFLADKSSKRSDVFAKARAFLTRVVEENAIGFPQDKQWRDWTFNYYSRSAQYSLQHLAQTWSEVAPAFVNEIRSPSERWDYCQDLLDQAINGFSSALEQKIVQKEKRDAANARAAERKRNRRKVRDITLAERKKLKKAGATSS
ncbi:hypothetical protein [Tardiphaga sp. 813_E8_N1_3]|uniref:hypothetical protein n=1 Tax=Tardiphaga sp. 813_E8_N1_3 TaxID=3240760 RepID=UPI003F294729